MKKFFKITGIVLAVFMLLLLILPFAFQGKIKNIALNEANKMLTAKVYMGDLSLSFFKHFPNASVTINDFGVAGMKEFKGDTLANAKKLCVVINLKSLFSDQYVINQVELEDADVYAKVLPNGKANWDIVKPDTTKQTTKDTSSSSAFQLALDEFDLSRVNVVYDDQQTGMKANVDTLNLSLSGDISQKKSTLANIDNLDIDATKIGYADSSMSAAIDSFNFKFSGSVSDAMAKLKSKLNIASLSFAMGNIPYASKVKVNADINMDADMQKNKYTFTDNSLQINAIKANFSGFVQKVDSSTIDMDVKLNTPKIDFKEILSLIPSIYANDFSSIKTSGKVALQAWAKGRMQGENLPAFDVKLLVDNAMFKYPSLPSQVDNININAEASNPGGSADRTTINISKFSLVMARNPFSAHLLLKTPISDPDFDCGVKGTVDFNTLKNVVKLDGTQLSGILTANASALGRLSYVKKEEYGKFKVNGNVNLKDMTVKSKDIPYVVQIILANLNFSNKSLDLTAGNFKIGRNDLSLTGNVENFLPYILADGVLKARLAVKSNYLNANDFLSESTTTTANNSNSSTTSSSVDIPGNIDFALSLAMNKLIYTNIELDNVKGAMSVKDKVAQISSLTAQTMDGSLTMSGTYDDKNTTSPQAIASIHVTQMSIPKVFTTMQVANAFAPALANATGKFNMGIDMNTALGKDMSPVLNTVNAKGTFSTKQVGLQKTAVLDKLADQVKIQQLKNPTLKNLNVKFSIKNGRMSVEPFTTALAGTNLKVSGSSGLDKTLDYTAAMSMPNTNAVSAKTNIPMKMNVLVGGTFDNPKIKLDASGTVDAAKTLVKEKATKAVKQGISNAVTEAKAQQAKLMAAAQKQADAINAEAKTQGDKLVSEAQSQSDNMVNSAKNPIEKIAKKKAGEKLVKEAQKKSSQLQSEAQKKSDNIIKAAQTKGDALVNAAEAKSK